MTVKAQTVLIVAIVTLWAVTLHYAGEMGAGLARGGEVRTEVENGR